MIRRLVYGGDYLFRDKFAFAARYCTGLLLNNVFILAGVVALASTLAILWRGFDTQGAQHICVALDKVATESSGTESNSYLHHALGWLSKLPQLHAFRIDLHWDDDVVRPFLPTLLLIGFWLTVVLAQVLCWIKDFFTEGRNSQTDAEARDYQSDAELAQRRRNFVVRGLCWLVFGGVLLASFRHDWLADLGIGVNTPWHYATVTMTQVAVVCLLFWAAVGPLRKWIFFGIARFHQVVLALILFSLLIGVAILCGNRDLSVSDTPWNPQNSLLPWGTLLTLLLPFLKPTLVIQSATQPRNPAQHFVFIIASTALLVGAPLVCVFWIGREDFSRFAEKRSEITPYDFMELPTYAQGVNQFRNRLADKVNPNQQHTALGVFNYEMAKLLGDHLPLADDSWDLTTSEGLNKWTKQLAPLNRLLFGKKPLDGNSLSENQTGNKLPIDLFLDIKDFDPREFKAAVERRFTAQSAAWLVMLEPDQKRYAEYVEIFNKTDLPKLLSLRQEIVGSPRLRFDRGKRNDVNRLLLTAWYPGFIRTRQFVATSATVAADQDSRANLLMGALIVFILAGCLVDPNRTSIQQYYRNQLSGLFVANDELLNAPELELHSINTTDSGTAVPPDICDGELRRHGQAGNSEATEMFLFSREFCGSRQLHYARTDGYLPHPYNSLANAVAVSGAALSPTTAAHPLLFAVMMILNLHWGNGFQSQAISH